MESPSPLPFFDEFVDVVEFDLNKLGSERADFESSSFPTSTVTLASLNGLDAENEKIFNLGFEGGTTHATLLVDDPFATVEGDPKVKVISNFRSPSPMSMTASMSGSEPYSLSSPNRSDMDDAEFFELLQNSGVQEHEAKDEEEADPIRPTESAMLQKTSVRRRSSSMSVRGVSHQSGPWCKTKNRNSSKNAIAARENRQKKKQYISSLEEINSKLTEENSRIKRQSGELKKKVSSLEEEVGYLRKVLFNQSALAGLLKRMNQSDVRLTTNFKAEKLQEGEASTSSSSSGGICLHTDGEETYLKFCSSCARKAKP